MRREPLYTLLVLFILNVGVFAQRSRVLIVGAPALSHLLELSELGVALADEGHEVWMALRSDFPSSQLNIAPQLGVLSYRATEITPIDWEHLNDFRMAFRLYSKRYNEKHRHFVEMVQRSCEFMMRDLDFMSRITEMHLDLVIVDAFPLALCFYVIPHYLRVPFVSVSAITPCWFARVPSMPSATPCVWMLCSEEMTFLHRVQNLMWYIIHEMFNYTPYSTANDTALLKEYAPGVSSWSELAKKSLLFIVTRENMMSWPEPKLPNVIRVTPLRVRPARPLNSDFEKIMSTADVILVSFGSISGGMPDTMLQKFFDAFRQVPQTVLWSFAKNNSTLLKYTPENVYMLPWLPQNDILGHARTVLFITHCGNGGQYEAAYHGVPMIGFPLFADQHSNAARIQHRMYGIAMNIETFTTEQLVAAINHVTLNGSYRDAISKVSAVIKDRPMDSLQIATYWIQHVLKFGGNHLRSHSQDMPLYQFLMIDVLSFICMLVLMAAYLMYVLFRLLKNNVMKNITETVKTKQY